MSHMSNSLTIIVSALFYQNHVELSKICALLLYVPSQTACSQCGFSTAASSYDTNGNSPKYVTFSVISVISYYCDYPVGDKVKICFIILHGVVIRTGNDRNRYFPLKTDATVLWCKISSLLLTLRYPSTKTSISPLSHEFIFMTSFIS